jgi:hypothetical protein
MLFVMFGAFTVREHDCLVTSVSVSGPRAIGVKD